VDAVVAADGTLAYIRGVAGGEQRTLVWVDRQGRETPIAAPPRAYTYARISPKGGHVVVWGNDQESDLWVWDFARLTLTRLTFTPGLDNYPVWHPDSRRVLFSSERDGERNLFWQAADGTGAVEQLTRSPNIVQSTGVSPDGTRLIFTETAPTTTEDVMQVELTGSHLVVPLVQSPFTERNGIISPDGRWLAYEANDSGQLEIYVRPYPDVKSGRWQVSTGGGTRPLWSRTGQEMFYVSPAGAIVRVGVEQGASWAATAPATIVKEGYWTIVSGSPGRNYDVSPDGQRFLVLKRASEPNAPPPQLVVVQHFDEELKRLVPTN
jgi:serine/threonine-protein kinase